MSYFDDIQFVRADVIPGCTAIVDTRFAGTYSLEFLLDGWMFYGVDGGRQIMIHEPIAFWHHPRHTYQYGALSERGWDHHYVLMKGPRAKRIVEQGLMRLSPAFYLRVPEPRIFAEIFSECVELIVTDDPRRHADAVVLLERLVAMLTNWSRMPTAPDAFQAVVELIAEQVRKDPAIRYDFKEEAAAAGLSYSHFRRIFRNLVGRAPHDYLLACRMQLAARLLRNPALRVKEIAYELGYDDPAQFSKLFKNKVGLSPQQYRDAMPA